MRPIRSADLTGLGFLNEAVGMVLMGDRRLQNGLFYSLSSLPKLLSTVCIHFRPGVGVKKYSKSTQLN